MRREQINKINVGRLSRWKDRLNDTHATPVLMIGVGHDHYNGKVILCTTEDLTDSELLLFMQDACRQLEQKIIANN